MPVAAIGFNILNLDWPLACNRGSRTLQDSQGRKIRGFRGDTSTSGKVGKVRNAKGDYLWDVEGVIASCRGSGAGSAPAP
jgi:hypothetical protein